MSCALNASGLQQHILTTQMRFQRLRPRFAQRFINEQRAGAATGLPAIRKLAKMRAFAVAVTFVQSAPAGSLE